MTRMCVSYALVNDEEYGAWGGYSASELQPLRHRFASGETLSSLLNLEIGETGLSQGSDAA